MRHNAGHSNPYPTLRMIIFDFIPTFQQISYPSATQLPPMMTSPLGLGLSVTL